jgi:hypothetical protein
MKRIAGFVKRLILYLTVGVLGFVVGAFALYVILVRAGPPLQLWHTEKLTSEYSEKNADEIRTFD